MPSFTQLLSTVVATAAIGTTAASSSGTTSSLAIYPFYNGHDVNVAASASCTGEVLGASGSLTTLALACQDSQRTVPPGQVSSKDRVTVTYGPSTWLMTTLTTRSGFFPATRDDTVTMSVGRQTGTLTRRCDIANVKTVTCFDRLLATDLDPAAITEPVTYRENITATNASPTLVVPITAGATNLPSSAFFTPTTSAAPTPAQTSTTTSSPTQSPTNGAAQVGNLFGASGSRHVLASLSGVGALAAALAFFL